MNNATPLNLRDTEIQNQLGDYWFTASTCRIPLYPADLDYVKNVIEKSALYNAIQSAASKYKEAWSDMASDETDLTLYMEYGNVKIICMYEIFMRDARCPDGIRQCLTIKRAARVGNLRRGVYEMYQPFVMRWFERVR